MTHLGEKASALVDGQLPLDAVERAHAHLANCRECRDFVEAERLMKTRLNCLPAPEPALALVGRLLALGGPSEPLAPLADDVPSTSRPAVRPATVSSETAPAAPLQATRSFARPSARPSLRPAGRPAGTGGAERTRPSGARPLGRPVVLTAWGSGRHRARLAGAVLGALGVVGAGVGGLVIASPGGPAPAPARVPLDSFVVQRPAATPTLEGATWSPTVSRSPSPSTPVLSSSTTRPGR